MSDDVGTQNEDGTITLPEVTIVGDPAAGAAYNAGEQDALQGKPSDALDRVGFGQAQPYLDGYADGQQEAAQGVQSSADAPPYTGPSIGPLSAEEYERGKENMKQYEEEQREQRRFLGLEPDPNEPGPHIEAPETPEITPGPGTL
jgi:hypothetical protein